MATGASVAFETITQAEVLARTGVDYDGLGVTFLGAQEIRSSVPTGDGVAMTSGGFGPMVQPGQTVVSYRILADAGRGVGELSVINGASVAPNGDVVSNPLVVPQGDLAVATSALGTQTLAVADGGLRTAATLPAGPPVPSSRSRRPASTSTRSTGTTRASASVPRRSTCPPPWG